MKRYEMVKLLSERSPFDLRFKDDYKLLLGVKTEIRLWCDSSELWRNVHYYLQSKNSFGGNLEMGKLDFRPLFNLEHEAMAVVRTILGDVKLNELSDEEAKSALSAIIYCVAMEQYADLLIDEPVSHMEIEGIRWILAWLQDHTFNPEVMTDLERVDFASF